MKFGKCPKCGSENIYRSPNPKPSLFTGNYIAVKMGWLKNKGAYLVHYVCDDCNYLESYVAGEKFMQNIHEVWIPLNPQKSKRKNDE